MTTPTTQEVADNIIAQQEIALNQTIPLLMRSFMRVLSKTLAGVFIILYKYGGRSHLDQYIQTASNKDTTILGVVVNPLRFWCVLVGAGEQVAATNAELLIDITVENQTGSLPSGTQLLNTNNGVTYITIGAVLLDAAIVQATIRAASDQAGGGGAGVIGNLEPLDIVSFANPLPNVARDAVVDSQTVTAADGESTEAYRQRGIDRFQKRVQGGAYADYEVWTEETAGIINAYPYTSDCPGQVDIYCEATVASSGDPDGIPTTAQLEAALALNQFNVNGLASRRPAGALVNTFAITRVGFDVDVLNLSVDNLATVQAQLQTAVSDYFLNNGPYIVGLSVPPRLDIITRSALIGLVNTIVAANNGTFSTVTFAETLTPTVNLETYILAIGQKSKLSSSVTFS